MYIHIYIYRINSLAKTKISRFNSPEELGTWERHPWRKPTARGGSRSGGRDARTSSRFDPQVARGESKLDNGVIKSCEKLAHEFLTELRIMSFHSSDTKLLICVFFQQTAAW